MRLEAQAKERLINVVKWESPQHMQRKMPFTTYGHSSGSLLKTCAGNLLATTHIVHRGPRSTNRGPLCSRLETAINVLIGQCANHQLRQPYASLSQ
jgi:hypothetical protein